MIGKARDIARRARSGFWSAAAPLLRGGKRPEIYDCFIFFNELDLLEVRFAELYDKVDAFVLAECSQTFTGAAKPMHFRENAERFARYRNKIIYCEIPPPAEGDWAVNPACADYRTSQFYQRNSMWKPLADKPGGAVIFISDVDEIPSAAKIEQAARAANLSRMPVCLDQDWHLLFLNGRVTTSRREDFVKPRPNSWLGTFCVRKDVLAERYGGAPNIIWNQKWGRTSWTHPIVSGAGWHFSYMGGLEKLKAKKKANGMREYSREDLDQLKAREFIDCRFELIGIDDRLPLKVRQEPNAFADYLIDDAAYDRFVKGFEADMLRAE